MKNLDIINLCPVLDLSTSKAFCIFKPKFLSPLSCNKAHLTNPPRLEKALLILLKPKKVIQYLHEIIHPHNQHEFYRRYRYATNLSSLAWRLFPCIPAILVDETYFSPCFCNVFTERKIRGHPPQNRNWNNFTIISHITFYNFCKVISFRRNPTQNLHYFFSVVSGRTTPLADAIILLSPLNTAPASTTIVAVEIVPFTFDFALNTTIPVETISPSTFPNTSIFRRIDFSRNTRRRPENQTPVSMNCPDKRAVNPYIPWRLNISPSTMTPSLKRFKIACTSFPYLYFHFYFPKCDTYVTLIISTFFIMTY